MGERRLSMILARDAYWANPVVVDVLSRAEVYDMEVAEWLGDMALLNGPFDVANIAEGDHLPSVNPFTSHQLLRLIIDSRLMLNPNGREAPHPSIYYGSRLSGQEFDMGAQALEHGTARAISNPLLRFSFRSKSTIVEVSRMVVYATSGTQAPFVGRPGHALLQPIHIVPNVVLPRVPVGVAFEPPTIGRASLSYKIAEAQLLTQHDSPEG